MAIRTDVLIDTLNQWGDTDLAKMADGVQKELAAGTAGHDGLFGMITRRRAARDNRKTGGADGEA